MKIAFTPIYALQLVPGVYKFILYFLCIFTEIDSIHNYMCNWKFLKWRNKI